jgi:transcriptional regulator with XRE-family HTH domain
MKYYVDHPEMINSVRNQLGMSVVDLARMTGVSSERIVSYEQARTRLIDVPTLTTMAETWTAIQPFSAASTGPPSGPSREWPSTST